MNNERGAAPGIAGCRPTGSEKATVNSRCRSDIHRGRSEPVRAKEEKRDDLQTVSQA